MIKKIKNIRNFGIYKNYQEDPNLSDFKKYNLIYGWNASGKTTLSRLFRCFELKEICKDFPEAEFKIQMDNDLLATHKDLDQISNIRVFNKNFIDENVWTPEKEAKPIYYLGKENIEQNKKLQLLKKEKQELERELNIKESEHKKQKTEKEKFIKDKAKQIKTYLNGSRKYTNYNKSHFCKNIENLTEKEIKNSLLQQEELSKKQRAINQNVKEKVSLLKDQPLLNKQDCEKVNAILEKTIVSENIEKLKSNKTLNNWIKEGLSLYKNSTEDICDFCEQSMPKSRIEALEKHFSQDYKNLLSDIDQLKQNWQEKQIEIPMPDKPVYDDLTSAFKEKKEKLQIEIKQYNHFINNTLEKLEKKRENPFQKPDAIHYKNFQITNLINDLNTCISQHNERTNNFDIEINKIAQNIERHFLSESYEDYNLHKNEFSKLEQSVKQLEEECSKTKSKIEAISINTRDYKKNSTNSK